MEKEKDLSISLLLGLDKNKKPYYQSLAELRNMFIFGITGTARDILINNILNDFEEKYDRKDLQVALLGMTPMELENFVSSKNLFLNKSFMNMNEVIDGLNEIIKEINARIDLFNANNMNCIEDYNNNTMKRLPYIVVLINDYFAYLKGQEKTFSTISLNSKKCGVYLIYSTARAHTITQEIASCFDTQISYKLRPDEIQPWALFKQEDVENLSNLEMIVVNKNKKIQLETIFDKGDR